MIAGPIVRPREAAFDQSLVNGFQRFFDADDRTGRQHFYCHVAISQRADVGGEILEHDDFIGFRRDHRLHTD